MSRKLFLDAIEETLKKPLHLAHRNKKTDKKRAEQIQLNITSALKTEFDNETKRYLEDFVITISDLMVYFFLTRILTNLDSVKSVLMSDYKNICKWYLLMQNDEQIFRVFSQGLKDKVQFDENSEINLHNNFEKIDINNTDDLR